LGQPLRSHRAENGERLDASVAGTYYQGSEDRTVAEQRTYHVLLADAREVYSIFGRPQAALATVDRALALEPKNIEALNLKAAVLYELDRDDEARECHLQALEIQPCSIEALHGLAAISNDQHRYQEALEWIDRGFSCVELDPSIDFRENEDYRQRLLAELYSEKAFALWYLGQRDAVAQLIEDGSRALPMEVETLEEQLAWLEEHPNSPEE